MVSGYWFVLNVDTVVNCLRKIPNKSWKPSKKVLGSLKFLKLVLWIWFHNAFESIAPSIDFIVFILQCKQTMFATIFTLTFIMFMSEWYSWIFLNFSLFVSREFEFPILWYNIYENLLVLLLKINKGFLHLSMRKCAGFYTEHANINLG